MSDASVPPVLYHYTNASGLKGILETGSLWATDAEFLNDAQELQFGRSELCHALRAHAESLYSSDRPEYFGSPEYSRATIVQSAVHYLETGNVNEPITGERMYVACFCTDDDLLSQWRGTPVAQAMRSGFARRCSSIGPRSSRITTSLNNLQTSSPWLSFGGSYR